MRIKLIDFQNNPDLVRALQIAARRERSRQLGRLLGNAIAHLFPKNRGHAPRTHLARQG
jgi:hypothetical protein